MIARSQLMTPITKIVSNASRALTEIVLCALWLFGDAETPHADVTQVG